MLSGIRILLVLCVACLATACSDDSPTPEAQIRAFIETAAQAAERRDAGDLEELVHAGYLDQKGYNRQQLTGLLRGYFFRHKNIHLFTRIEAIELLGEGQAEVRLYVAMAGSAISGVDALASLRAQIYRFELELVKQDDWLLRHASWEPAGLADLH